MDVIAFVARKGGVGKSTLVCTFAVLAYQRAQRDAEPGQEALVAVIDQDHQGCTTRFFNARAGRPGPRLFKTTAGTLSVTLRGLRELGYSIVLVDSPPGHSDTIAAAMRAASEVVIPVRPSELDLEAARETIKMAVAAGVPYQVLLNDGTFRTRGVGAAKTALEKEGVPLLPVIHRRVDIPLAGGECVVERAPESTAAKEVTRAFHQLMGQPCREM